MSAIISDSSAEALSKLLLVTENGLKPQIAQVGHRQNIITVLGGISAGSKVLELGCGQGDCTIVLADAVGENGSVVAVDPSPPGYGSPFTVEEAQKHISTTTLGPRISWVHADSVTFLPENSPAPQYDVGILCHSLWYFSSPKVITETLRRLRTLCRKIFIAEWSLTASSHLSYPHVLAALTQASLECRKPQTVSNVRTVVSSAAITKLAQDAGLKLVREGVVENPGEHVYDGHWEVSAVADKSFIQEIETSVQDERERAVVHALRDATLESLKGLPRGVKDVRSMNVWCGVFEMA